MKYAAEMGSSAMIYMPSFVKIGSAIQKLMEGGEQRGESISLLLFFKIRKYANKLIFEYVIMYCLQRRKEK
jgi:hypothetical protein